MRIIENVKHTTRIISYGLGFIIHLVILFFFIAICVKGYIKDMALKHKV